MQNGKSLYMFAGALPACQAMLTQQHKMTHPKEEVSLNVLQIDHV